jgi:hypothetical protein
MDGIPSRGKMESLELGYVAGRNPISGRRHEANVLVAGGVGTTFKIERERNWKEISFDEP